MKKHLRFAITIVLFLVTYCSVNAKEVNSTNNKVIISLNPKDCTNCINNLRYLYDLNDKIGIVFILQEKYKEDSLAVKKSLNLSKASYLWIWSDSLNKSLMVDGKYSSVIFLFGASKKMIKYDLKTDLKKPLVVYFNKMSTSLSDTFTFKEPIFNSGTGKVLNVGTQMFTLDKTINAISGFNMINGEKEFSIRLTDSIMQAAFLAKFKTIDSFNNNLSMIKSLKIIRDRNIKAFDVSHNQISVLASYTFFRILKPKSKSVEDTFELKFEVVHEFDMNGKYLATFDIHPITIDYTSEAFLNDRTKFDKSFYGVSGLSIKIISKNVVLMNVMRHFDVDQSENKFVAYFKKSNDGSFIFDHFYTKELPKETKGYGYNLTNIEFSNNDQVFTLPLVSAIYSTNDEFVIPLDILKKPQYSGNPFSYRMFFIYSALQDSSGYLYVWNNDDMLHYYYQFDRKSGAIKEKKIIGKNEFKAKYCIMDYFDNSYLLLPISNNTFIREKIF